MRSTRLPLLCLTLSLTFRLAPATPVPVTVVDAHVAMVVAGHPEAAAIGLQVLQAGGNAIDAAVAVSLALGVAEPYGSGLGGKLMLLYFDASTGQTHVIDALDEAPAAFDLDAFRALPAAGRRLGWSSFAVPGLLAGLELAHQRWGDRPWADNVAPATTLAREGATVLAKTRDQFAEQLEKLHADPTLTATFLPGGELPKLGRRLPQPALAGTLDAIAIGGAAAFYRGDFARAAITAAGAAGTTLSPSDFTGYTPRLTMPLRATVFGVEILGAPPPATGPALFLPMLQALAPWADEPVPRDATALDRIGRIWRIVQDEVADRAADTPTARADTEELLSPAATARHRAVLAEPALVTAAVGLDATDIAPQSTTHFVIVDAAGNTVSATQSLSLHFGAGLTAPGTGVVLNNSLSNFATLGATSPNLGAPGKRPRSTISPTLVLRDGRPILALGLPGGQRIPTAMFQVLYDHLGGRRELAAAIGDVRWHLLNPSGNAVGRTWETEAAWPSTTIDALVAAGWLVETREPAGTGRYYGGFTAIQILPDGTRRGFADTRRTNAPAGY